MRRSFVFFAPVVVFSVLTACSSSATSGAPTSSGPSSDDASTEDAGPSGSDTPDGAAADGGDEDSGAVDKAAACVKSDSELGTALTSGHGRVDGIVTAVVPPGDEACPISANATHMTIEVKVAGKIERVVITAQDKDTQDGKMYFLAKDAPLVGPAWAEGWHSGADVALDYVSALGVHGPDFKPLSMAELTKAVTDPIALGDKIALVSTVDDKAGTPLYGTRSHLVHRYSQGGAGADGAIVLHPDTSPTWLLFYYASEANF